MVAQVACPGLQDAQHANLPTHKARILGKLLQSCGGGAKEQRIDRLRVCSSDGTQFGGQREGDQEVGNRQEQRVLRGEPGLGSVLLAGWTMPVATGVIAVAGELTGRAAVDMAAKRLGSARFDRLHRPQLALGQRTAKAGAIGRSIAAEDRAKRSHRMPAESVSSTPLASSCAFWVRWV